MKQTKSNQKGWSTIEMMITFPLLVSTFLVAIYFALVLKSHIALQNATHAAAQALSKTKNCATAYSYLKANFDQDTVEQVTCAAGETDSVYESKYTFAATNVMLIPILPITLKAKSVAMTIEE